MDPLIGKTLSHFRILDRIDAGKFGVVYRARDEQLRRDVAIKVLSPAILADESARKRFRHEALALSRLNHPNIETVFGFDTQDGVDFLVVEYVGGQTLERRLRSGPLTEDEAILRGIGIADALDAAHSNGVVHCDLKPANVGLTSDERVKVLDFGLAQVLRLQSDDDSMTQLLGDTLEIAGTLPYMAPEQLLGKRVDGRVDLYALGVLLFRSVVGQLPFSQPVATALIDDILHKPPPDPRTLSPTVSPRLESVILRCLEKDPALRYQTAADLRADLVRLKRDTDFEAVHGLPAEPRPPAPPRTRSHRMLLIASAAVLGILAAVWFWVIPPPPPPQPPDRQITFIGQAVEPAISPDGQYAAYVDRSLLNEQRLFVQDLTDGEPLRIFSAKGCELPRWSPDGRMILCQSVGDSGETATLVPRLGGTPRSLPSGGPLHSWAPDGRRFVSASAQVRRLLITDIATGDTSSIPLEGFSARIVDVDWSPREDRIVVLANDDRGLSSIWSVTPGRRGAQKWLADSSQVVSVRWSPAGDALYVLRVAGGGGLKDLCKIRWRTRPDHSSTRTDVLLRGLPLGEYFSISRDGRRLLYTREPARSNLWLVDLEKSHRYSLKYNRPLTTSTSLDGGPSVSPDGKWVAFSRGAGPRAEIFRISMDAGQEQQLTFMNSRCRSPVWSESGDTIAFVSDQGGIHRLWRVGATGGVARPYPGIELSDRPFAPVAWAPRAGLLCAVRGDRDYVLLDTRTGRTTTFGSSDSLGWILSPQFSPDGTRLAWWVPDPRGMWIMTLATGARVRVWRDGPVIPVAWSPDGRWIYAMDWRAARTSLLRFPSAGGAEGTRIEIPNSDRVAEISVSRDGTRAVCVVLAQQPDVWLTEGFDRGVK